MSWVLDMQSIFDGALAAEQERLRKELARLYEVPESVRAALSRIPVTRLTPIVDRDPGDEDGAERPR